MSVQDDAFEISNVFEPVNDDCEPVENEKAKGYVLIPEDDFQCAKDAWINFRKWAWTIDELHSETAKRNRILTSAIKIVKETK